MDYKFREGKATEIDSLVTAFKNIVNNKNPNMDIDDYYMYKLYYNTQIEPCPISEAIGGFIKSGVDIVSGAISGTINYTKDLITNPVDTFVKTYHGITNAIVSG